jgi:hypothetical protein
MRSSSLGLALLFSSLALLSACSRQLVVLDPAPGSIVKTPSFDVRIRISDLDPATVQVKLNDQPIPFTVVAGIATAHIDPGPPLRDENLLLVTARAKRAPRLAGSFFLYLPPKARAHRITRTSELMKGPLAQGRIGDWLIENDVARFIVQDAGKRDLHSIGEFGGNLIDAELVGHPGLENFQELQPAVNIETVINAQTIEVVNDGEDGTPAILRSCGPDDLLDYANPSSAVASFGVSLPPGVDDQDRPVEGCTEYRLSAGRTDLAIETTIFNLSDQPQGLYVGDFINGSGELEQWTNAADGTRFGTNDMGIGEVLANLGIASMSFMGYGEARGVDYAMVPLPLAGASPPTPTSSFTTVGVSYVLAGMQVPFVLFLGQPPVFVVPAAGSRSFTRLFEVGPGNGASAVDLQVKALGLAAGSVHGCVTVAGAPAPEARVVAGSVVAGKITGVRSVWTTDANGCYQGTLPTGQYGLAAARTGTPYEGGGPTPLIHMLDVAAGSMLAQDFDLPATGHVHVTVRDQDGEPVPARVTVVGFDPSPDLLIGYDLLGLGLVKATLGTFNDASKDPLPFGIAQVAYAGASGDVSFDLEPGSYQVVVSRGTEWSAWSAPLAVGAGSTTPVSASIAHVVDTSGFVSSDFHVHAIDSPDSPISHTRRVSQFAGEGVDNIIMTDHDAHTDLRPDIQRLDLVPFVHSTVGEEITTFDYGHFNGYPLGIDPSRPSRGSTDWGGAAPPGEDFPSLGHYVLTPAEIHAAVLSDPVNTAPHKVVQVNHINSHFTPLKIDTAEVPPRSHLSPGEALALRLDPSVPNFYHHFPALELWNGANRSQELNEFLQQRIGVWFNHLNQGLISTAIADTDTHEYFALTAPGARTWTASSTDAPAAIDDDELAVSVLQGRAVGGQGLYVQARLVADSTGQTASLALGQPTLLHTSDGTVHVDVRVQAPLWAPFDRIEVYANSPTVVTGSNGGVPTEFGAAPQRVANAGSDFAVDVVPVASQVPGGSRYEANHRFTLTGLAGDTWIVVVARGTDGVSHPLFPVMPLSLRRAGNGTLANLLDGNLGEDGVLALGFTNALYVDVDGNGVFDAPLAP